MSGGLDETEMDATRGAARVLAAGTSVGKYKLVRELGTGGMGVVWAAHDPDLDREVALKLLRKVDADPDLRKRLLREARAMARLKHPNVLTVYEVGSEGDRDFIAMELIDGGSLDAWLATKPQRKDVITTLLAAGAGLAAAHDAGLVHRDFKPHNVLRSSAGTVRVTDFGLARGVTEGVPFELVPPSDQRRTDPVLDSTLTQTGAVLGTPAYMAPEQFDGAVADPLSDQFAFCVTAWQALAGTRPYKGTTLEELRRAIGARERDAGRIPRLVRRVLARGLEPDPKRRWPNMTALLRQLSRAFALPRRAAFVAAASAAIAGIAVIAIVARREPEPAVVASSPCAAGDAAFDTAWSAPTRSGLATKLTHAGYSDAIPKWLDGLRARWIAIYANTCAHPDAPAFHAQLGCLLGARDSVASLVDMLEQLPINQLGTFDVFGAAPQLAACTSETPPTPPAMPADRDTRAKIATVRARAHALLDATDSQLRSEVPRIEADARAIQWPPLVARVLYSAAVAARRHEQWSLVHDLMPRAAMEAQASRDPAAEAQARIDRYEIASEAAENVHDDGELDRLANEARAAIRAAGDDPAQRAALDIMEARVAVLEHAPERALAKPTAARDALVAAGDDVRAAVATRWIAEAYMARDQPGDLDAAAALIAATRKQLGKRSETAIAIVKYIGNEVAWRRGKLDECEDNCLGHLNVVNAVTSDLDFEDGTITGHVIGPDGAPVKGASVVTWRGVVSSSPDWTGGGMMMMTDKDGAWGQLPPGSLVAAHDDLRTIVPRSHDGMTVQLRPTHSVRGTIASATHIPGLDGCVLVSAGPGDAWLERVPAPRDGAFTITRVPDGAAHVCATDGIRRVFATNDVVRWPSGATLDVIVRGTTVAPRVWTLRGHVDPRTRAELDVVVATTSDVATAYASVVGQATATAAGRALYKPEDRHAVFRDNEKGAVTACTVKDFLQKSPVKCARADGAAVVIDWTAH